ncbi:MAG: hypothetical protein D6705_08950 [Deltaproteobacteria bacterium]|nr:MAG: hypothetical protein D6705_08950 [Deltaproteobacteria bacterium]
MSDRPAIDLKWTIIGAAVIVALNQLAAAGLGPALVPNLVEAMGDVGGLVVFALVVAVCSFFVGGLLVGWLSPGETLAEPAIACVVAVVVNGIVSVARGQLADAGGIVGLVIAAGIGFALGLLGAKVGERIQGDTTDKMRERGEL